MVLSFRIYTTIVGDGSVAKFPSKSTYDMDELVTLIATPDGGCSFVGWSGDASGSDLSIQVTSPAPSPDGDLYITATFTEIPSPEPEPPGPEVPYDVSRGIEDFLTFNEIDPEGNISVTTPTITYTNANRNVAASVYKTFGKDYITDFAHRFSTYISLHESPVGIWAISNGNFTLQTMINKADGISLFWASSDDTLILRDITANAYKKSVALSLSTKYYITMIRHQSVTSAKIYTDEDRTNLVDTISVTGNPQSYSTLMAYHSYDNVSYNNVNTGYVQMFETLRAVSTSWMEQTGVISYSARIIT
jgi:hypothetical protein